MTSRLQFSKTTSHIALTIGLVLALLFTQWVGFVHSVVHAGWQGQYVSTSTGFYVDSIESQISPKSDVSNNSDSNVSHSCTLFDALTLAATVHTPPYLPLLLPTVRMVQLWVSYISHVVRFIPHFCSRAPPSA